MKVLETTPSNLTLQLRPWFLWLFGVIFTSAGLVITGFLGQVADLSCDRLPPSQGSCELKQSTLLGSKIKQFDLGQLQGADLASSRSSNGQSTTYRIVLLTESNPIPFTSYYSSGYSSKQATVSRITSFLSNPSEVSLRIRQDDRLLGYAFGSIFMVIGLTTGIGFGKIITCKFDKPLGQLTITRQGLLGHSSQDYALQDIQAVTLETSRGSKGSTTYRVSFVMKTGDRLPLTAYYSSGYTDKQRTAEQIREFLNLPDASS